MKEVSSAELCVRAYKDKRFLNDLLKRGYVERALQNRRMALSSKDIQKLKQVLNSKYSLSGADLFRFLSESVGDVIEAPKPPPPPPFWDVLTNMNINLVGNKIKHLGNKRVGLTTAKKLTTLRKRNRP